jgi:hypothetical protein
MDFLKAALARNSELQLAALAIFISLIPLFSGISVFGIRRTVALRRLGLLKTYPGLTATIDHARYMNGDHLGGGAVKWERYILPIAFLFVLNIFMSVVLLDFDRVTDHAIGNDARVYILCGGHCSDAGQALIDYQTQTFVSVSYAFLGWMVWTFATIFDRAGALQLFPSTFNRLLIRLVVAVLVAIVLRHMAGDFPEALKISGPTLSFFAGMFPERGLALIVSKFEDLARSKDHSEDFDLELIEGITPGLTYRLSELGADSAVSLIGANPFAMFDALLTPMSEILDWIAQAHLFVMVKSQRFTALQNDGYRTIFDLERLLKAPEGRATLQKTCGWDLPPGYDLIASIHADGDYKRLVQLYLALGNDLP